MLIRSTQPNAGPSIELTPMIDMVFLLLIFFLVATTFHKAEREIQIALPLAASGQPISATLREIVINVDAEGNAILSGRRVEPEELRTIVADAVARNAEQKVTVRGDRTTAYTNVVAVLDVCKAVGVQEPYLDTEFAE